MNKNIFKEKIIEWYLLNKRLLPWRETNDAYTIWLSEIILQQTRVVQGIPYYLKFVERFPDVMKLSDASETEVLRLWQGLGYYTRARNLHKCSKVIVQSHGRQFPHSFAELQKLPGIGPYTAAAIASIAFKEPVAVIDGNVFRVLARFFGIELDISLPATKRYFFALANGIIPNKNPDEFNQAMMEFGAMICTPNNPKCGTCVLQRACAAYERDEQKLLPVKSKKIKIRNRYLYYFVIRKNKRLMLRQRDGKDIWKGLYDFLSVESPKPARTSEMLKQSGLLDRFSGNITVGEPSAPYRHILTHQKLLARFIPIELKMDNADLEEFPGHRTRFYSAKEVHMLPKPVLVSKHLADIGFM